ncbi:CCHC-type domain-containing protein [Trichonephila clavipes]|nr:CCHC-type domain-containing protein [Trichonephila clavipes]
MVDGIRQTIMALSTVVDLYIEGKVIATEFLVLPDAKGNKTLLGLDFLNAAGIALDVQGGKWHFSGKPRKQYKFFKKTLEDITLSAFELREDEGKNLSPEQARTLNILLDRNEACFLPGGEHTPFIEHHFDTGDQPPITMYPYRMNPVKKQDYQEPETERNTGFVAPLRKRRRPKKDYLLVPSRDDNGTRGGFNPEENYVNYVFCLKVVREGPYLILTLRSPVTYEIADPANPDQALGTYHVSALKDSQEPETERNTGFVAPLRKRRRPKKELSPGSEPRRQRNQRGLQSRRKLRELCVLFKSCCMYLQHMYSNGHRQKSTAILRKLHC